MKNNLEFNKNNFKREFSAGCIVFKRSKIKDQSSKIKVVFLLGKHSGYHKWVLPKGLIEKGEHGFETALRETEEEVGIKAKLISTKPISIEKYMFYADYKSQIQNSKSEARNPKQSSNSNDQNSKQFNNTTIKTIRTSTGTRRVIQYQEAGGKKIKVFKIVSFYLAEFDSGDPKNHGWEMEEAGWFDYDEAVKIMSFKGEKQALQKAFQYLRNLAKNI